MPINLDWVGRRGGGEKHGGREHDQAMKREPDEIERDDRGPVEVPWGLCPRHRHIGTEASGNEIVCDLDTKGRACVLGLWHDPPRLVLLARGMAEWSALRPGWSGGDAFEPEEHLPIVLVEATGAAAVEALGDAALASWIGGLPEGARVFDLRARVPGAAFEWSLSGEWYRYAGDLVFAVLERPPPPGLLRRLFRR